MHDLTLILLGVCVLSILAFYVSDRTRLSSVITLLLAGLLVSLLGPRGVNIVPALPGLATLSEIGIVLLMFRVGIQFRPSDLRGLFRAVLIGGCLQMALTIAVCGALMYLFGVSFTTALWGGILATMSSTMLAAKELEERQEFDEQNSPHGRVLIGILVFQDLSLPVMVLLRGWLQSQVASGPSTSVPVWFGFTVLIGLAAVTAFALPRIIRPLASSRSQTTHLLVLFSVGLLFFILAVQLDFSPAVGTFLAGLALGQNEWSREGQRSIRGIEEVLLCAFFISVGMMFDARFVLTHLFPVIGLVIGLMTIKFVIGVVAALCCRERFRTALMVGAGLVSVGELSFVLANGSISHGLLSENQYKIFVAAVVLSMLATPIVLILTRQFRMRLPDFGLGTELPLGNDNPGFSGHVILAGWGIFGQNVGPGLFLLNKQVVGVDRRQENVAEMRERGFPAFHGNINDRNMLRTLGIGRAELLVVAINDEQEAVATLDLIGNMRSDLPVCLKIHHDATASRVRKRLADKRAQGLPVPKVVFISEDQAAADKGLQACIELLGPKSLENA